MGTNRGAGHATVRVSPRKAIFGHEKAGRFVCRRTFVATFGRAIVQEHGAMTSSEIAAALPKHAVTSIDGLPFPRIASGKVREIFDLGDALLLTASDRLSAFDVILPDGIPGKGAILTQMSNWWFAQTGGVISQRLSLAPTGESARRRLALPPL